MGIDPCDSKDTLMPNVLFVCMANQFRSPLAAALFEKRLNQEGSLEGWTVGSAGTWVDSEGGAHPTAIIEARNMGMDLTSHQTREVTYEMISATDLVVVMAHGQKEALQFEFPSQSSKIVMLSELSNGTEVDLQDPALKNFADCDEVFAELCGEMDKAFNEILRRARRTELNGKA
jgi:protein-tyrosine phosphatase